jgi:hypothetical protein
MQIEHGNFGGKDLFTTNISPWYMQAKRLIKTSELWPFRYKCKENKHHDKESSRAS